MHVCAFVCVLVCFVRFRALLYVFMWFSAVSCVFVRFCVLLYVFVRVLCAFVRFGVFCDFFC